LYTYLFFQQSLRRTRLAVIVLLDYIAIIADKILACHVALSTKGKAMDETAPRTGQGALLRNPADRASFARAVLALPILAIPATVGLPGGWLWPFAALAVWFALADMNFLLHQHVHRPWTRSRAVNLALDLALSAATAMSATNWRASHVRRHHRGDDSWGEGFAWEMRRASPHGAFSYAARGVPIIVLRPLADAFVRGFATRDRDAAWHRHAFAEQAGTIAFATAMIVAVPEFYAPYYFMVLFFTRLTDYENHVGCDAASPFGFSNNSFDPVYNWVRQNFGYHTAHHYYPGAHWSRLPELHAGLAGEIPPQRLGVARWTGFKTPPLLAYAMLRIFTGSPPRRGPSA
jgi:fatty acid desaturase